MARSTWHSDGLHSARLASLRSTSSLQGEKTVKVISQEDLETQRKLSGEAQTTTAATAVDDDTDEVSNALADKGNQIVTLVRRSVGNVRREYASERCAG